MATMHLPALTDDSASSWDKALYTFLAEKERRSGSMRTVQSYSRMLADCFGRVRTRLRSSCRRKCASAHGAMSDRQ